MDQDSSRKSQRPDNLQKKNREIRRAANLRANLRRRKDQQRGRIANEKLTKL